MKRRAPIGSCGRRTCHLLRVVSPCLHTTRNHPNRSREALCLDVFRPLLGLMTPVLPPLPDSGSVRIKDTSTPETALMGRSRSLLQPTADGAFRHAHPLGHLFVRDSLRTPGCHLPRAIITTGLTRVMGVFHTGRRALLPGGDGWQHARALFHRVHFLRGGGLSLPHVRTAVPKDLGKPL